MQKITITRIIPIAIVLLAVCAVTAFSDASRTFHETYRIAPDTPVSVDNTNGDVDISTWDEDYAEVHADLKTTRGSDELELVEVVVEADGVLRIETRRKHRETSGNESLLDRLFGRVGGAGNWPQVNVEFHIKLPRNAVLTDVSTVNGTVRLDRTFGDTDARTTNGQVDIRDHTGSIRARSTNGNIAIKGAAALIEAKTTNGSIDVEIEADRTQSTTIETVNGGIDVTLPKNLDAALDIRTVNGGIDADGLTINLEKVSKRQLIGTLGSGGPVLTIKTVNGGVDLRIR